MTELATLHSQARRLILRLHQTLEKYETTEAGRGHQSLERLETDFQQLQKLSVELDSIWRMHVIKETSTKRDIWKRKVEQISEDVEALKHSIAVLKKRSQRLKQEAAEREELFARREDGAAIAARMDEESQLATSIHHSKSVLEETFETAVSTLETMTGNKDMFKKTQRRMLDVLNTVGLSESLLKLIDRRQRLDVKLTYCGMLVVVLFLIPLCWWYL